MEIQVETFEQTEVMIDGQLEATEEAIALIKEMELEGQKELLSPVGDTVQRCPYREITQQENRVYLTLFPTRTPLESYKAGMIPLRILQLAAHAKQLRLYNKIEVWSEEGKPLDPILVGHFGPDKWNAPLHIFARWGTALAPFPVLYERAKKKKMEQIKATAQKKMAECQQALASLEAQAITYLGGDFNQFA